MPTRNISLTPEQDAFVDELLRETGRSAGSVSKTS